MAINSSEISGSSPAEEALDIAPRPKRGMAITNKAIVGAGKSVIGAAKLTKNVLSPPVRLVGRNLWGAKWGIATAVSALGMGVGAAKPGEVANKYIEPAISKAADVLHMEGGMPSKVAMEGIMGKSENNKDTESSVIDVFYPYATSQDKEQITFQVKVTEEHMKGILTEQSYKNIQENMPRIEQVSKYSGVPVDVLVGMALTESRGGVDTFSDAGAAGPYQIMPDMAKDYRLKVTGGEDDERLDWGKSLPVVAQEVAKAYKRFNDDNPNGDWGLAVWRWHLGQRGVEEAIERYSADHAQGFTNFSDYIKQQRLSVYELLNSESNKRLYADPGYDSTDLFVDRVAACAAIVRNVNRMAMTASTSS